MGLVLRKRKIKPCLQDAKRKGKLINSTAPIKKYAGGRPKGSKSPKKKLTKSYRGLELQPKTNEKAIQVTNVFDRVRLATKPIVVCYGGSRSSKSFSVIQDITDRFFTIPKRQILVLRKTLPSLRMTTYKDFYKYLSGIDLWKYVHERKMLFEWHYKESLIHFGSLVDPERVKSSEWNDIWMEEATEFTFEDYVTLRTRMSAPAGNVPNRLFLTFNPIFQRHWIKERLIDTDPDVDVIHSTYRDNPFLAPEYIRMLEGLQMQDENYWRIFGEGMWGALQNIIYTNWHVCNPGEVPKDVDVIYGLDFGYSQNESALVKIYLDGYNCWAEQLIYERGLTTPMLIERMREEIHPKYRETQPIYADNAEPDRIQEIKDAGFYCIPCYKGEVKYGIDFVKRYDIGIFAESTDLIKEIKSYVWKKDKAENILDQPVKFADHLLDAMRYALLTHGQEEMGGRPAIYSFSTHDDDYERDDERLWARA